MAVAHVESRKANQEFRIGKVEKFYLPFGIHQDYKKKWPHLDLWPVQVYWATKRLAQFKDNEKAGLKKWNIKFNQAYWLAVKRAWIKYERGKSIMSNNKQKLYEYAIETAQKLDSYVASLNLYIAGSPEELAETLMKEKEKYECRTKYY